MPWSRHHAITSWAFQVSRRLGPVALIAVSACSGEVWIGGPQAGDARVLDTRAMDGQPNDAFGETTTHSDGAQQDVPSIDARSDTARNDVGILDAGPRMPSVTVAGNDPGLVFEGRWAMGATPVCDGSGCAIRFRVEAAQIFATFSDWQMTRPGKVAVFVDGQRQDPTVTLEGAQQNPQMREVMLVGSLPPGVHEIAIVKATEPLRGRLVFQGLRMVDATRPLPVARTRRIEFIGDSITCGGGNIGPSQNCGSSPTDDATWYEDSAQAYPLMTANELNAALTVVAESGIGVTDGAGGQRLRAIYERTVAYPEGWSSYNNNGGVNPWGFSAQPDAIVINLGTNDLNNIGSYASSYRALVDLVRARNPNAHIFMMVGGIIGGDINDASQQNSAGGIYALYQTIITEKANAGDTRWHRIHAAMQAPSEMRCNHPSVAFHQTMATLVAQEVRQALGW